MSKYANYLLDLGLVIKKRALEARRQRDTAPSGGPERECYSGKVMAFGEVLSIMQQQAEGFEIPLAERRLDDIEPDRDLT